MQSIVAILCFAAMALASPQIDDRVVAILRDDRVDQGDGNFNYAFAADNGIETEVVGTPGASGAVTMQGYYLVPLADGGFARVEFIANENGFQPQSQDGVLPTPHPLPAHAIEQLRIAEEQRASGISFDNQGRRL